MSAEDQQRSVDFTFHNVTVFSDGSIHRDPYDPPLLPACPSPSSPDLIATADLTLNHAHGTWIRLFKPPTTQTLPILLYFHGGGFVIGSSSRPLDHSFLCKLAAHAHILIVSVEYRLAPEHPLPVAYEDSIESLLWLNKQSSLGDRASHPWLARYADFSNCFLGGDSAGANIAHHVAMWVATGLGFEKASMFGSASWCAMSAGSKQALEAVCVQGVILIQPFFTCGEDKISEFEAKLWKYSGVSTTKHAFANPLCSSAPSLAHAALPPRILVAIASKDMLAARDLVYHQALVEAGKDAKLFISQDEGHFFHIVNADSKNVPPFLDEIRDFINLIESRVGTLSEVS